MCTNYNCVLAGTRKEVANPALLAFLQAWAGPDAGSGLTLCMSVCTGAALLAAAGLLDGRRCDGLFGWNS
jgi:transcriptional regulator GlxA family with amidase domain